ncbi:hypothetical protein B0H17DRAFT_1096852 [Mycena rosella]|uniref:Uncharacterized protein n=1 Tax=Mycena rosella TaxID=1033263 RepID=A0AAD7CQP5_MYCRO|nr:hypothetical protein B0H17DRAFT_1096852 [Mycena rosella]
MRERSSLWKILVLLWSCSAQRRELINVCSTALPLPRLINSRLLESCIDSRVWQLLSHCNIFRGLSIAANLFENRVSSSLWGGSGLRRHVGATVPLLSSQGPLIDRLKNKYAEWSHLDVIGASVKSMHTEYLDTDRAIKLVVTVFHLGT